MDPMFLTTAALSILSPFIKKTGEKFAEKIGEDVWTWIKKGLTNKKEPKKELELPSPGGKGEKELESILLEKINSDSQFKAQLEDIVKKAQNELALYQQNIGNHGTVEKQINIQHNTGNITM